MSLTKKVIKVKDLDVAALKGVALDSRSVKSGYLFAALPGRKLDGHKFVVDAIRHGATHILAKPGTDLPEDSSDIILVSDDEPRKAFTKIVASFYPRQPDMVVAVTGTNGKTSTVHFVNQLWKMLDLPSAALGTLGLSVSGAAYKGASLTTPDPVSLHAELSDLSAVGVEHLAMEASSHGLDQFRLDGVRVKVAAFTNFSRDHLDYHADMAEYLAAKMRLFSDVLVDGGVAVLNADLQEYKTILNVCKKRKIRTLTYGRNEGAEVRIVDSVAMPQGQGLALDILGVKHHIILPLVGDFQAMNAVCAFACVMAEALDNDERTIKLIKGLEKLKGVPGRLQLVQGKSDCAAYVDFAHKPEALESVLASLKGHVKGRLICVFGCGGDRDHGKRPVMGEIASRLADIVIVTDDNPRTEVPEEIRGQILKGVKANSAEIHEIGERRDAIEAAAAMLQAGDVLVVAGKGHEKVQIFNGHSEPFDDVEELEIALRNLQ